MSTKNILIVLISGIFSLTGPLLFAHPVYADMCTTDYGGTTTCKQSDLTVNKIVQYPGKNGTFVDNLSANDPTFAPGSQVLYRLIINNASGQTFDPVNVKDILPEFMTFVGGPGTYDSSTRTLTFSLNNLIAGETRTVDILAQVNNVSDFDGKSFVCVNNYAEVRSLNRFDSDTAQVCLATGVLGVTTLPSAGFNDYLFILPFAAIGMTGLALIKVKR